ncbi:hypothetical protein UlMin_030729 [Ulmus minor]
MLAVCSFDMLFTYVVTGWEGAVHDSRVLTTQLEDPNSGFPHPPPERCFGVLKARFPILRFMTNFSLVRQREIAMCCCVLHNFIKLHNRDDPLFHRFGVNGVMPPPDSDDEDNTASSSGTAANPHGYGRNDENFANSMRDHIMIQMYLHYNM